MSIAFNNKRVIPKDPWQRPRWSKKEETLRVWGRRVSLLVGVFGSVGRPRLTRGLASCLVKKLQLNVCSDRRQQKCPI